MSEKSEDMMSESVPKDDDLLDMGRWEPTKNLRWSEEGALQQRWTRWVEQSEWRDVPLSQSEA